jgi:hypothetical protein
MVRLKSSEHQNLADNKLVVIHVRTGQYINDIFIFLRDVYLVNLLVRVVFRKRYLGYLALLMGSASSNCFLSMSSTLVNITCL